MAKQRITVCLPPCDQDDPESLRRAIGRAMAPYDYNREDSPHPDWVGEWDYWFISGAGCEFAVLPGHEDDPRLLRHDEWKERPEELPRSRCHGGPRGLLDLDTDRAEVAREAARRWDDWRRFADRHAGGSESVLRAVAEDPELRERFTRDPYAWFGADRAAYVAEQAAEVLPTPAMLTLGGRWVEYGGPGYRQWFNAYLQDLPADTMVVRVLYHS
ncbi:hypothetical protein [Streptomyces sp. HD]|uniref:hypothetical protein n=1 Tax=Streptomyces sp. HD TaxID=3020892 RepID=UPI00232AF7E7|nr:hypothetical protein [Streptomyces sp. HD]MDC0772942.1 hypothetical protein [Streptomyces sp. HD]